MLPALRTIPAGVVLIQYLYGFDLINHLGKDLVLGILAATQIRLSPSCAGFGLIHDFTSESLLGSMDTTKGPCPHVHPLHQPGGVVAVPAMKLAGALAARSPG